MTNSLLEELQTRIHQKYQSMSEPTYWFVQQAIIDKPYKSLVNALEEKFGIHDQTTLNVDVSFQYLLTVDEERWMLELSMLGPYAVLTRVDRREPPLSQSTPDLTETERYLIRLVQSFDIVFLEQDILERPIALKLSMTEPEYVRFYQALFADTWLLPWEPYEPWSCNLS